MADTTLIRDNMPVVDCNGVPLGTVGGLDAGRLRLAVAGGRMCEIALADVSLVDDDKVTLQTTRDETMALMRSGEGRDHTEA
ncbi:DUF2171 domain-containing protein [Roseomonas elaeocarpi]|uniref:DUF2171 domain-containing protein n=1 Tax=Roseomonas elaeocarpi TaxID=907779 RepID=A0ABV6JYA6_9PROT